MKWNLRRNPTVTIVGCTGAVGRELIRLLGERAPAFGDIHLLASETSVGTRLPVNGDVHAVRALGDYDFTTTDIAFFAVGAEISEQFVPKAVAGGCLVIDKSAAHGNHGTSPPRFEPLNQLLKV